MSSLSDLLPMKAQQVETKQDALQPQTHAPASADTCLCPLMKLCPVSRYGCCLAGHQTESYAIHFGKREVE